MGCGCGKKRTNSIHFMGKDVKIDPEEWGPILWKYLHCIAEHIGTSGSPIMDADQATYIEAILTHLHLILPCTECQEHATKYISSNPIPSLKELRGEALRSTVRNWLFQFHNTVRQSKGQPILINSIDEYIETYKGCFVPQCEYTHFIQSVAYAVRQGWVRIDNWKKWYSNSERLRLITGNIVT